MKPIVVVLGKNYSTSLGIVRGLGRAGYRVEVYYVAIRKGDSEVIKNSKYVSRCVEHVGRDDRFIIDALKKDYTDCDSPVVLVPTDDYTASLIDRNNSELRQRFLMPNVIGGEDGSITKLMDKSFQNNMAKNYGFKTARSWSVQLSKTGILIPGDIVFPCFCKPVISAEGGKEGMKKFETESELRKELKKICRIKGEIEILVQEYLNIEQEYAVSGVCCDQDVIIPALSKKILTAEKPHGVTIIGEIVPFEELPGIKDQIIHMLQSLHYTGLFDVDLFQCEDGIYFGEVNFRSSGVGYAIIKAGVNQPAIFVRNLLGEEWEGKKELTSYGQRFYYERAAWINYLAGNCKKTELKKYIDNADFSLIDEEEDPEPGKMFLHKMKKKAIEKKLKNSPPALLLKAVLRLLKLK